MLEDRAPEAVRVLEGERGEAALPEGERDLGGREQRAEGRRASYSEFKGLLSTSLGTDQFGNARRQQTQSL